MNTKQLCQKILDLAIRGKLVPQDPADEPASVLLERIHAEKERMIKEGKIKRGKTDSAIAVGADKLHYEQLPDGWTICRLNNIGQIVGGGTPRTDKPSYWDGGEIPWITPADLSGYTEKYISSGSRKITERGLSESSATLMPVGSVLFSSRAPIGYIAIATNEVCTNQGFKSISPYISGMSGYIYYYLKSQVEEIRSRSSGTTFKEISGTEFGNTIITFPPIAEQHRIVAAIESAFRVIDEIERNKSDLQTAVTSAKSKILSLAVRGKLVPQDPADEPASVLLERIRAEKEALIKAGKIKRDNGDSAIVRGDDNSYYEKIGGKAVCIDEQIPFEVPESWTWARISQVSENILAGGDRPIAYSPTETENYSIPIYSNGIDNEGIYGYTDKAVVTSPSITVSARGTIGFSCIRLKPFCPIVRLITITPATEIIRLSYLHTVLRSLIPTGEGSSISQLTIPSIKPKMLPIPPVEEQERINKAVESNFVVLDEITDCLK